MEINEILSAAIKANASDIHFARGMPPVFRIGGQLVPADLPPMEWEETNRILFSMMNGDQKTRFAQEKQLDFSYAISEGRFRVNVFHDNFGYVATFRVIPPQPPEMKSILMPEIGYRLARLRRGLVLVTGPTGSGKTTTLAAMIELINNERNAHIITIEDPIEFVFENKKALIHQRAITLHTPSFPAALKACLRQDPDVILVGEMREVETIAATISIAETGPLVFATLHTINAAQTLGRIIEVFPSYQQQQIKYQLSVTLKGIISQQLIPRKDRPTRIAAREILEVTPPIENLIREGQFHRIPEAIKAGSSQGMILMDDSLKLYAQKGIISKEEAIARASNPEEMAQLLS